MAKKNLRYFRIDVYDMACEKGADPEAAYDYAMGIDQELADKNTAKQLAEECAREWPARS